MYLTLHLCRNCLTAALNPLLDLSESCVEAYRKRILTRNLEAVVFCRIMRRCDLHRSLEAIVGSSEVNHRSGAQSDIINIGTCVGKTFEKILMDLWR